jgi:hypothetical protein
MRAGRIWKGDKTWGYEKYEVSSALVHCSFTLREAAVMAVREDTRY